MHQVIAFILHLLAFKEAFTNYKGGIIAKHYIINSIRYANDSVLCARNMTYRVSKIKCVKKTCGFKINRKKPNYVVIRFT